MRSTIAALLFLSLSLAASADEKSKADLFTQAQMAGSRGDAIAAKEAYCQLAKLDPEYRDATKQCAYFTSEADRTIRRLNQNYLEGLQLLQEGKFDQAEFKLRFVKVGPRVADAQQKLSEIAALKQRYIQSQVADAQTEHTKWIDSVLRQARTIKPGMTRQDLLQIFGEEGGMSTRTQRTYVYKDCPFIKVDVEFAVQENPDDRITEPLEDKIVKISRPYLNYSVMD
jgi:hypothetical protein